MSEHTFQLSPSVSIIVAGVIIAGAIVYTNLHPAAPAPATPDANRPALNAHVPAPSANDHIVGSLSAPIVLIEYADFQCPFCALVHPTLKKIVSDSNGHVAWVMRNFPLSSIHPNATPAANAAECIAAQLGNKGWWRFADDIFQNQSKMNAAYYASLAQSYGADVSKFNACVSASTYQSKIDAQTQEAEQNGGQGTPYTIVYGNGQQAPVSGAQPEANFMAVIKAVESRPQ